MTVEEFIRSWLGLEGGAERSNLAPFIYELCDILDLPRPGHASGGRLGDYEFDGTLPGGSFRSFKGTGFIDLYKRGHFVLEAKQSQLPPERQSELGLFEPGEAAPRAPSGARYDKLMADARAQAEHYAKNLPGDHPPAPFIIVLDIGRAFEILFDYTGNGRGYGFFPDKQSYRIPLSDLASDRKIGSLGLTAAEVLRAIWTDPDSISPRFQSADVTRKIAERLAEVSKWLEETQRIKTAGLSSHERSLAVEETALFLMRILFCMFAEDISTGDVELLPKDAFKKFLERSLHSDDYFESGLADLWLRMNTKDRAQRFAMAVEANVRYFNGGLFASNKTYRLGRAAQGELLAAAGYNWRKVEPAIFGTLLEQALTKEERAKLGAHYTPRPYVERLVQATIMDVLEPEWAEASQSPSPSGEGLGVGQSSESRAAALAVAQAFHDRLADLRILDPACGTGNFLYVAMESLQHLENKVIERIQQLGGDARARVGPHQFHGLELNPRAAKIAELVLWIGWLRFRIANDPRDIHDPVLGETASINFGRPGGYDAVLTHTATGDVDAEHPMVPEWPEADFIIGNPPFIGGKDLRERLGSDYAQALWKANPRVPASADFVMQWWDHAALLLARDGTRLRRFGFVTTNSITQEFSRRVISGYLDRLSLVYAIPDHPWTKAAKDSAAVRIAMTVAEAGKHEGCFTEVVREAKLDSDEPEIALSNFTAAIHANLTVGADVAAAVPLLAGEGLASRGVSLHGDGFIVTPSVAQHLGLGRIEGLASHIRPYRNGRDLLGRSRGLMVIDLFGLREAEVRMRYPDLYQHLLRRVWDYEVENKKTKQKAPAGRKYNNRQTYKDNWWIFGEPRGELRPALEHLPRYIATIETAKHRTFEFLDREILPDNKIVVIADSDAYTLGVLSAAAHLQWTYANCGLLGVASFEAGHVYVKSKTFDPFPFPDPAPAQRAVIAELGEELDATRKLALTELPGLTMTELYNLRDRLRSGAEMSNADQDRATAARAGIVNRLHEQLDAAVAQAYGWGAEWPLPPSEIVTRLVALNAERAAEEKAGRIRWLRPDYQEPRFGRKGQPR